MKLSNQHLGSRTSLPQEQHIDNYAPYNSLHHRGGNYDDYPPTNGSPHGGGTPTRFNNNHYDDYGDNYRNSPTVAYEPNMPMGYGGDEGYDPNHMQQQEQQYPLQDSSFHNDSFSR